MESERFIYKGGSGSRSCDESGPGSAHIFENATGLNWMNMREKVTSIGDDTSQSCMQYYFIIYQHKMSLGPNNTFNILLFIGFFFFFLQPLIFNYNP